MDHLANFVTIAGGVLGIVFFGYRWVRRREDSRRIVDFLTSSAAETEHKFRSTHAMASNLGLSESRVGYLAARCPKIRRNQKDKESWTLR